MADQTPHRAVRWALWLAAGMVFGLLLGFAAALAQPRENLREPTRTS